MLSSGSAFAHPAQIEGVDLRPNGDSYRVSVTISHPETGWEDYADGWRVEAPDGTVLGTRVLAHPHETEQPFTRSLSGVVIPDGLTEIVIRARTLTTGWDSEPVTIPLP
ncbi:hypothetical protein FEV53_09875 [Palleronia caenipelagi]|uniref:Uncharacterized protein n=1 Tax=Palleronia caenipelagi TaxID=2489174 RepID=A0A547Q2Q9_9RHOB|nr:hypothetical protein FEV53_09875 [Palleronia caenipelagi]